MRWPARAKRVELQLLEAVDAFPQIVGALRLLQLQGIEQRFERFISFRRVLLSDNSREELTRGFLLRNFVRVELTLHVASVALHTQALRVELHRRLEVFAGVFQ